MIGISKKIENRRACNEIEQKLEGTIYFEFLNRSMFDFETREEAPLVDIDEYIKKYHLVDFSKIYKNLILDDGRFNIAMEKEIDFRNLGRFTYSIYNCSLFLTEMAACESIIIQRVSKCEKKKDGTFVIDKPIFAITSKASCPKGLIRFNEAFKYKDEALTLGFKKLEERYLNEKKFFQRILSEMDTRIKNALEKEGMKLNDGERKMVAYSLRKKVLKIMEVSLREYNLYAK